MHSFSFLIGNGLSVAYSAELSVAGLTTGMIEAFEELAGGPVEAALSHFASSLGGEPSDFERLLAPLENAAAALPFLKDLSNFTVLDDEALAENVAGTTAFLETWHRVGLGTVLELIADRAHGEPGALEASVKLVCSAIADLETNRPIDLGTLNYDGLLSAGLLDLPIDVPDLAAGYAASSRQIGDTELPCWELRSTSDLTESGIQLLNLHGSLGWLYDNSTGEGFKFRINELREAKYWELLREGMTELTPLVVLTDQKSKRVTQWPFGLAYGVFERRLVDSDRWCVGGYGFQDKPVNRILRDCYKRRNEAWNTPPRILVIDAIDDVDALLARVANAIGADHNLINVEPCGFPDAVCGTKWDEWGA